MKTKQILRNNAAAIVPDFILARIANAPDAAGGISAASAGALAAAVRPDALARAAQKVAKRRSQVHFTAVSDRQFALGSGAKEFACDS